MIESIKLTRTVQSWRGRMDGFKIEMLRNLCVVRTRKIEESLLPEVTDVGGGRRCTTGLNGLRNRLAPGTILESTDLVPNV